jgi:hypothetical protein
MGKHTKGRKTKAPLKCGKYLTKIVSTGFDGDKVKIGFRVMQLREAHTFRVSVDPQDCRGATQLNGLAAIADFSSLEEMLDGLDRLIGLEVSTTIWMLENTGSIPLATRYAWTPAGGTNALPIVIDGLARKGRGYPPCGSYIVNVFCTRIDRRENGGSNLTLVCEICEGRFFDQVFVISLPIVSGDTKAQLKARSQLSRIMTAIGLDAIADSDDLKNKPFRMRLWRTGFVFPWMRALEFTCLPLSTGEAARVAPYISGHSGDQAGDDGPWAA